MGRWIALVVLAGCYRAAATAPPQEAPVAGKHGLVWATQPVAWQLPISTSALALDGATALAAGEHGAIARIDLATGLPIGRYDVDTTVTLRQLQRLRDGRWLVVGSDLDTAQTEAYALDPKTLAATKIALPNAPDNRSYAFAASALLPDGAVMIVGPGLPLSSYDPATWQVKETFAEDIGWGDVSVIGTMLTARHHGEVTEIELSTKRRTVIPAAKYAYATRGWRAMTVEEAGGDEPREVFELHETGKPVRRLPAEVSTFALDPTGTIAFVSHVGKLVVYELPSLKVRHEVPLANPIMTAGAYAFDGQRVVFQTWGVLRLMDLASGAVNPFVTIANGDTELDAGNDGSVLALGNGAWLVENGVVVKHDPWGEVQLFARTDDARHYATGTTHGDRFELALREVGTSAGAPPVRLDYEPESAMFDGPATLVIAVGDDNAGNERRLVRTRGGTVERVFAYHKSAKLLAAGGGDALLGLDGRVSVVDVLTRRQRPVTLRAPRCVQWVRATLDPLGVRAALYDQGMIAVWDRRTGKLLAAAAFEGELERVELMPDDEIALLSKTALMLWVPGKRLRRLPVTDVATFDVSPNGKRIALGHRDETIEVYDTDALRAAMTAGTLPPTMAIAPCEAPDPARPAPVELEDYDGDLEPDEDAP